MLVQLGVHVAHVPLLQPYAHGSVGGVGLAQALPLPGHVLANWCVDVVAQVAAKHWVPAGGKEQLSDELSQRPPQVVAGEPAHAARLPAGWPEATRVQVPVLLLQVWH